MMIRTKIDKVILNEEKFLNMSDKFGFKVDIVGENIALIKSEHDNWQTEVVYRDASRQYEIRLNHMNRGRATNNSTRGTYHLQTFCKTYYEVLKYIKKHDSYLDRTPNRDMSRGMKELNKMNDLFNMISAKGNTSQAQ